MPAENASPYLMDEPPTSTGRILLSRAFSHWCVVHHGYSDHDVYCALDPEGLSDDPDRREILWAARLLGELLCAEVMRAFTRPIGGGSPAPLAASAWERDDFRRIFANSGLDPSRPFDDNAEPTHWIFLDADDFNNLLERSVWNPADESAGLDAGDGTDSPASAPVPGDDHVRMPELERRTGMSRATIYRRISQGRFPKRIPMDGNISAWRESEVAEWLANPR